MEVRFQGRYTPVSILRGSVLLSGSSLFWYFLRLAALIAFLGLFVVYGVDVLTAPGDSSVRWMRLLRYSIPFALVVYMLGKSLMAVIQLYLESGVRFDVSSMLGVEFPWNAFYRKHVAADFIALRTMDGSPVIFRRSFFQSETDWQTVQNWVKTRIIEAR